MKILFKLMILLVSILSYQSKAQTQETATLLECNNCYSDFDFINKAKQNSPGDGVWYFVIDNYDTRTFKTVRVIDIQDPDIGHFKRARILQNLPEHVHSFNLYFQIKEVSIEGVPLILEYPEELATSYSGSATREYITGWVLNQSQIQMANIRGSITYPLVQVNFKDGSKAIIAYLTKNGQPALNVIAVYDEFDTLVEIITIEDLGVDGNGSSPGPNANSNYITLPGGITICYGECPIIEGIVTVYPLPNNNQ